MTDPERLLDTSLDSVVRSTLEAERNDRAPERASRNAMTVVDAVLGGAGRSAARRSLVEGGGAEGGGAVGGGAAREGRVAHSENDSEACPPESEQRPISVAPGDGRRGEGGELCTDGAPSDARSSTQRRAARLRAVR